MKKTLSLALLTAAAASLAACAQTPGKDKVGKTDGGAALVAYFSATGTTAKAAEEIANLANADLYRIEPEKAYTSADLDWHDSASRSTVEMKDPASRPAVKGSVPDMSGYSVIFLGYPIWWGKAPRIINTFIEKAKLAGKAVAPFATSGGSPITESEEALRKAYPGISWKAGKLLSSLDEAEARKWVEESSK